ncbi:hypothetical protein [Candidatus Poriferisodalis sp.]|uniref:hypothetical protein n=1 Tax=Candidatus Poriferisodalis sp. TaxID=3101277 RepID=UPI003B01D5C3
MTAQPMSAELDMDAVTLDDLDAATGLASLPAGQSTGVIYGTDEEFLAHLADEPIAGRTIGTTVVRLGD